MSDYRRREGGLFPNVSENFWTSLDRRKFRRQTSDSWTDAATVVRTVREERASDREIERDTQSVNHLSVHQFALPSMNHNNSPLIGFQRCPIFETSATALCGPIGMKNIIWRCPKMVIPPNHLY